MAGHPGSDGAHPPVLRPGELREHVRSNPVLAGPSRPDRDGGGRRPGTRLRTGELRPSPRRARRVLPRAVDHDGEGRAETASRGPLRPLPRRRGSSAVPDGIRGSRILLLLVPTVLRQVGGDPRDGARPQARRGGTHPRGLAAARGPAPRVHGLVAYDRGSGGRVDPRPAPGPPRVAGGAPPRPPSAAP